MWHRDKYLGAYAKKSAFCILIGGVRNVFLCGVLVGNPRERERALTHHSAPSLTFREGVSPVVVRGWGGNYRTKGVSLRESRVSLFVAGAVEDGIVAGMAG